MKGIGVLALVAYGGTVLLSNWFISHVGPQLGGSGPHLLPVAPGLWAPSGVLWVAAALALRNVVQEHLGRGWAVLGILAGALLSAVVSTPALAVASGASFLVSEMLDMLLWTQLRKRGIIVAQAASNVASDVVDSVCFLWLAFGDLTHLLGQVVGKEEVTVATVAVLMALRRGRYAGRWTEAVPS